MLAHLLASLAGSSAGAGIAHWLFTRALNPGAKAAAKIDKAAGAPVVEAALQVGEQKAADAIAKAAAKPDRPASPAPKN